MNYEIIIIGGGASALMMASLLPKNSSVIIESNPKTGAKVLISGGGKCNITNKYMGSQYYVGDNHFTNPSLTSFNEKICLHGSNSVIFSPNFERNSFIFVNNHPKRS